MSSVLRTASKQALGGPPGGGLPKIASATGGASTSALHKALGGDGGATPAAGGAAGDTTFLTRSRAGLGSAQGLRGGKGDDATEEPPAMDRVRQLHGQLSTVVGALNEKVSTILKKQESEFLRAYRAHMYSVQKELAQLRAKADDAALQLAKNEKIRQLEAERDWYRSEALRLDAFCSSLKADVEYLRDKVTALEEDRGWLERQLKASKRNTALAGAAGQALDLTGEGGAGSDGEAEGAEATHAPLAAAEAAAAGAAASGRAGILATAFPGGGVTAAKRWGTGPKLRKPTGAGAPDPFARSTGGAGVGAGAPLHLSATGASADVGAASRSTAAAGQPQQRPAAAEAATAALIRRLEAQLANATRQLETYRTRTSRLKAANTSLRSSRGELETFFLQCVEDVRKEIARRRVRNVVSSTPISAAAGTMGMAGGGGHTAAAVESTLASSTGVDTAVSLARARQVSLSDFTGGDRRAVVSRLLQDEYVLQALHDVIFAGAGGGGAGGGHGSMPSLPPYAGGDDAGASDVDAGSTGGEDAAAGGGGGYVSHRAAPHLQPGLQHYPGEM